MRRALWTVFFLVAFAVTGRSQTLADLGFTADGLYDVQFPGAHMSGVRGLTVRYVNGQQRFLAVAHTGVLYEFVLPAKNGTQTASTRTWNIGSLLRGGHVGIWFEQAKNRLWLTSTTDYNATFAPATVTLVTLNDNGSTTVLGKWTLGTLPEKRCYGNFQPSPFAAGKYVGCGGGYTSLVDQSGGAAMGPVLYEIGEPTSQPNGSTLAVRAVLDSRVAGTRGVRRTIPQNYFDGGDARPNPSSPPTVPPLSSASWLSPNAQGLGWFTWGDSYYSTLVVLPDGRLTMVASLCKGKCYYMSSNLEFDWRQWELHEWTVSSLTGSSLAVRPSRMVEFTGPFGAGYRQQEAGTSRARFLFSGNSADGNVSGATYDPATSTLYLGAGGLGKDEGSYRVWALKLGTVTPTPVPTPTPTPTPTDAVVSAWSEWSAAEWSACANGTQTRTETRTRTVVTPATNGGSTPTLSESRAVSQSCAVIPVPTPIPGPPGADGKDGRDGRDGKDAVLPSGYLVLHPASTPAPAGYTKVAEFGGYVLYRKD